MNTYIFSVRWPSGGHTEKFTQEALTVGEASAALAAKLCVGSRGAGSLVATCKDGGIERRFNFIDGLSYDVTPKGQRAPEVIGHYALHRNVLLVLVARPGKQLKLYTLPVAGENHLQEANIEATATNGEAVPFQLAGVLSDALFARVSAGYSRAGYELAR